MGTKCILRGNEMHFVGSKSLYISLCPLPGSVISHRKSKKKIYFIFDKYKKIFHLVLKISAIPTVLRNREITGIFNTFDDIYLVFTSKK